MQLCSSSGALQPLAVVAGDEPRQHVDLGVAGLGAAARDQALEVEQELATARLPRASCCGAERRLERAEDRQRPVAQRRALGRAGSRAGCR